MRKSHLTTAVCLLTAAVWAYSAQSKAWSMIDGLASNATMFADVAKKSALVAWSVIIVEGVLSVLLSGRWGVLKVLSASSFLLLGFSLLIAVELTKETPRDCGCGGGSTVVKKDVKAIRKSLLQSLSLNLGLIGLSVPILWRRRFASTVGIESADANEATGLGAMSNGGLKHADS
jgi:hypothetical protein